MFHSSALFSIYKRELLAYFYSPIAYVVLAIFSLSSSTTAIFLGRIFDSGEASMNLFFIFQPWLYLFLVPAVGMRLWAEERNSGSIEFLLTLPISIFDAVLAKFLAGWTFLTIALATTLPLLCTVIYLGKPDFGIIFTGYLGCILVAGAYLSISCFASAVTRNQVISFIISFIFCFFLNILSWGILSDLLNQILPSAVADWVSSFGTLFHFDPFRKGLIEFRGVVFFLILMLGALSLNVRLLEERRI